MKNLSLLLFILLVYFDQAQAQSNCPTPIENETWFQELKQQVCTPFSCVSKIARADWNGTTIYFTESSELCADFPTTFYECTGEVICFIGGLIGSNCPEFFYSQLTNHTTIYSTNNCQSTCVNPAQINPSVICTTLYDPVCGCNGVTYSNECEAFNDGGVTSWTPGECPPPSGCNAENDSATTNENTPVTISLLTNDTYPAGTTITNVGTPAHGTVVTNGNIVVYTPNSGYMGTDTFTYTICGNTATVTVTITDTCDDSGNPDVLCGAPLQTETFCLVFCELNEAASIAAATSTCECGIEINGKCITYTPFPNQLGNFEMTITACDIAGACQTIVLPFILTADGNCDTSNAVIQPSLPSHIQLSPNPMKNILQLNNTAAMPIEHFALYDVLGKCVINRQAIAANSTTEVEVTQLPVGIYIAAIYQNGVTYTLKLAKN